MVEIPVDSGPLDLQRQQLAVGVRHHDHLASAGEEAVQKLLRVWAVDDHVIDIGLQRHDIDSELPRPEIDAIPIENSDTPGDTGQKFRPGCRWIEAPARTPPVPEVLIPEII